MARQYRRSLNCPPTRHELEVFAVCLRHRSIKEAAVECGVSNNTVKHLRQTLYAKLGADCDTAAAEALGWLVIPDFVEIAQPEDAGCGGRRRPQQA
jgi:DNA-binding NarL/FixJ family response regulator